MFVVLSSFASFTTVTGAELNLCLSVCVVSMNTFHLRPQGKVKEVWLYLLHLLPSLFPYDIVCYCVYNCIHDVRETY